MHDHAGERALVGAPRCLVHLLAAADHDAAYVDVSNAPATVWGQSGWWLGTAGNGRFFASPVGYFEYRLADGEYLWQSLGPPPADARYSVANTGLVMRDETGRTMPLYRITASYVAGTLATYPYVAARGDNAGMAESYSTGPALEPIGPTVYRSLELQDGGAWRLWRPAVDRAEATVAAGDRLTLLAPWHRWRVAGHLGPTSALRLSAAPAAPLAEAGTKRAARPEGATWPLFAPAALSPPAGAVAVGALLADRRGRLVGTALDGLGRTVLWRWRPRPFGGAVATWRAGDLRQRLGDGDGVDWVALADGGAAYAAGHALLLLPPGAGRLGITDLAGAPVLAAAAAPGHAVALLRAGPSLELWQPARPGRVRLAARALLPKWLGAPDVMAYVGGGRWLLDRPGGGGGDGDAYAESVEVDWPRPGRRPAVHPLPLPAMSIAAAGGVVAVTGGDRSHGVRLRVGAGGWRLARALNAARAFGDRVTVGADGRVWVSIRTPVGTALRSWRPGGEAATVPLPVLWQREDPPLARHTGITVAGPAAPPYAVALAAGRGWVAVAPLGEDRVFVAFAPRLRLRPDRP